MEKPSRTSTYKIGERLAELRRTLGMTQAEVAAGTATDTEKPMGTDIISRYESGTTIPGWRAIERILAAMGQTPCALFPDICLSESTNGTFKMPYYDRKPLDENDVIPSSVFDVPKSTFWSKVLGLPQIDDRFILARGNDDAMIPIYYPGDVLLIDRSREPQAGKIIVGFHKGEGMVRRLVREKRHLILTASNRRYPAERFVRSKWVHYGVLVWTFHNTLSRYVATGD